MGPSVRFGHVIGLDSLVRPTSLTAQPIPLLAGQQNAWEKTLVEPFRMLTTTPVPDASSTLELTDRLAPVRAGPQAVWLL